MAHTITSPRPWFKAKLAYILRNLTSYTAPTISATYDQAEVQDIADKLEEVVTLLRAGGTE